MNSYATIVRNALTDEPQTRHQIAESTGIELSVVSATLSALKSQGEASNSLKGWVLAVEKVEKRQEKPKMDIPTLGASLPKGRDCKEGAKKSPKESVPPRFYRGEAGDLIIDSGRPGAGSKRLVIEADDVDRLRRFIAK